MEIELKPEKMGSMYEKKRNKGEGGSEAALGEKQGAAVLK